MNKPITLWQALLLFAAILISIIYFRNPGPTVQKDDFTRSWEGFINRGSHKDSSNFTLSYADIEVPRSAILNSNCFQAFQDTMTNHGFSLSNAPVLTKTIFFGNRELNNWIKKYDVFNNSAFFKLKFGIYTPDYINGLPPPYNTSYRKNIGRIGIFIWPTNTDGTDATCQGASMPAFDLGGMEP